MLKFSRMQHRQPSGPPGWRAYVVGDVHGRLDLLDQLLERIHAHMDANPWPQMLLAFVGDVIDRGPSSAEVVDRLRTYRRDGVRTVFLLGNHEEVLLRLLGGDESLVTSWLRFGGTETMASYGVDVEALKIAGQEDVARAIRSAVPPEHVAFLETFSDTCRFGDYLLVHAGVRPGVPVDEQRQSDLRWIREPFLNDATDHGVMVIHGHTISPQVDEHPNRIGIDTGAYRSGVLTALVIEGPGRSYLDTREDGATAVSASH